MPRQPRFSVPGIPQHVIQRGNNREIIFCCDDDYWFYLDKLKEGAAKYGIDVHAYVLMTNHVHLLLTPSTVSGVGKLMQYIGRYYVQYFNHSYKRTGTLWEGRYKASLVDAETYLLSCYRYIELNPVRAEMVEHPAEYPWSSFRCNALGDANALLTPHALWRDLGVDDDERRQAYSALFETAIPQVTMRQIGEMVERGWVLGSDRFRDQIELLLGRRTGPLARGGDRKSETYRQLGDRGD